MSRKTSWIAGALVLASAFALLATPAQATLIIGFQFDGDGQTVVVPASGGVYTVNVIATSDNAGVTSLGIQTGEFGALSAILNANLGNGTLTGNATATNLNSNLLGQGGGNGDIGDVNGDSRNDIGPVANTNSNQRFGGGAPSSTHPWWNFMGTPSGPNYYANAASVLLGTFTVTIPSYTPNGNTGDFLRYTPNLQASNTLGYDIWGEITATSTTNRQGKFNAATGTTNVNIGSTVTFSVQVPEPATLVLLGLGGLGLITFCRPKRRS